MTDEDLKKLQKLIKEEIRPTKELIEIIKNKVDHLELSQSVTTGQLRNLKEQQSVINEKLDELKNIQENQLFHL